MDNRTPGSARLRERLELLRVRAAGHRLELALAGQDLREQTKGLRRGAGIALAILRMLVPRQARPPSGFVATCLRYAVWIIPAASTLIFKSKAQPRTHGLRAAFAVGTLGVVLLRFLRGVLRRREQGDQ